MKRSKEKTDKQRLSPAVKIAKLLDLPETAVGAVPMLEIKGNREVIIDGSQGVLEYTGECIRVNTGKMLIRFTGRNLEMKCMTAESLIIEGFIAGIDFTV